MDKIIFSLFIELHRYELEAAYGNHPEKFVWRSSNLHIETGIKKRKCGVSVSALVPVIRKTPDFYLLAYEIQYIPFFLTFFLEVEFNGAHLGQFCPQGTFNNIWRQFWSSQLRGVLSTDGG